MKSLNMQKVGSIGCVHLTGGNLNRLMEVCKEYRDEICSEFTGDVYFKVYDALN